MKFLPVLPVGGQEPKWLRFFQSLLSRLSGVLDLNLYPLEIVWNPPHSLLVPFSGNMARTVPPSVVRIARAFVPGDSTPVHFGSTSWEWVGSGQVRITDVDGLVAGVSYSLVVEVIG